MLANSILQDSNNLWDDNAHLLVSFIFLDDDERRRFALIT